MPVRARASRVLAVGMLLTTAWPAAAQTATPNAAGVAMGHLRYQVRDVEANRRFWVALGGESVEAQDDQVRVRFTGVDVVLIQGESTGGTAGSVVNHVAFRVPAFVAVEAAGLAVTRLERFPGVGSVTTPEGERIELFEDAALNLTFTPDSGVHDATTDRHNRPLGVRIAFHHIHLYVPDGQVAAAKAWYARVFGGVPGKRSSYDAVDLPGVNFNFGPAPAPTVPTKGRMLDRIGFVVQDLDAFCDRLEGLGVIFDVPCMAHGGRAAGAVFTDPWGTSIELTGPEPAGVARRREP